MSGTIAEHPFPFSALVGQEQMKRGLFLNAVHPRLSGVLIRGEKGTAKSTAVRSLAALLPDLHVVAHCPFSCDPDATVALCTPCRDAGRRGETLGRATRRTRVVNLPVSATEDRVVGTLDLEHALTAGEKRFEPGLLAEANRGILYVDEVNLLEDHLVDVLLDSAAMGVNSIEREGVSYAHPAQFILVGTMNPEEGELRPQLLDRFGLCVQVRGIADPEQRMEVAKRWLAYEDDPAGFCARWQEQEATLRTGIVEARARLPQVTASDATLEQIATLALAVEVDGHRADVVMLKAAKALAALAGRETVVASDVAGAAPMALQHRLRRQPFEEIRPDDERITNAVREVLGDLVERQTA